MLAYKSIPRRTAFPVERDEDCRSIWEHPTLQTYDPWGLGSGQSERMTQIACAARGWHRPRFGRHMGFVCEPCAIWKHFFCQGLFENIYMCCRKWWGSPFDQGESNGAGVWSVGFGFWPIRMHDSDHAHSKGGHRPRFGRHTAFVSEPCAIWKHLH